MTSIRPVALWDRVRSADWGDVTVMMICAAALALTGVTLMATVATLARRGGYRSSTLFSRRRAARLARLAARPVPTADQRVGDAPGRRRLRRLRRRPVVVPLSQATLPAPVRRVTFDNVGPTPVEGLGLDPVERTIAVTLESAAGRRPGFAAQAAGRPARAARHSTPATSPAVTAAPNSTTTLSGAWHEDAALLTPQSDERVVMGFDGVAADPEMLAALRRRVEIVPEVIEADPIDVDVINPARLTRIR